MKTFTTVQWHAIPAAHKGVWSSERPDMENWSSIRHQYLGKRTTVMDGALCVEDIHFKIVPTSVVQHLTCAVCGADAGRHEQHWNRDDGFGVCRACVDSILQDESPQDMRMRYGIEGINYAAPAKVEAPRQELENA